MRRIPRVCGALLLLSINACSGAPTTGQAPPKTEVTPIPTVKPVAAPVRPSPCEIAGLLVTKAESLRAGGLVARARRALDDAEHRCSSRSKEIGEARAKLGGKDTDATRLSVPDTSLSVAIAWAPDSSKLAALHGGELSIYDGDLKAETARFLAGRDASKLRWLPSGKGIVLAAPDTGTYRVLDLEKKQIGPALTLPDLKADTLAVQPDDKTMILTSDFEIAVADLAQKKVLSRLSFQPVQISDFAVSPAGDEIAVSLSDAAVRIYSFPGFAYRAQIEAAGSGSVTYLSDKKLVVLSTGRVATYDPKSGKLIGKVLENTNGECSPSLIGPKKDHVLWACYALLESQPLAGGKLKSVYTPGTEAHLYTSFDGLMTIGDGSRVWYSLWGQQYIVDTLTGKIVSPASIESWYGMQFRPDGKRVASVGVSSDSLWTSDLKSDERTVLGVLHPSVDCSLLGATADGAPVFADVDSGGNGLPGQATLFLRAPGAPGKALPAMQIDRCPESLSRSAAYVAIRGSDLLTTVDLAKGDRSDEIPLSEADVDQGDLLGSGDRIGVWGNGGIRVIDLAKKKAVITWKVPVSPKASVQLSLSGKWALVLQEGKAALFEAGANEAASKQLGAGPFAFGGDDLLFEAREGTLVIHDLAGGPERTIAGLKSVKRLEASPDGARVVAVTPTETHLIDTSGEGSITAHIFPIDHDEQIVFFASNRVLAVHRREDGSVRFYQLPSGTALGELRRYGAKEAVYLSETGNLETLGEGASRLSCVREPAVLPFSECAGSYQETGLLARTVAGRGCTSEDVGDVCD